MTQHTQSYKYFVTGGAGFIGSHLVDRLIEEGNKVTVYDNLVSGRKENIEHHLGKATFQFIEADLLDFDTLKEAMKGNRFVPLYLLGKKRLPRRLPEYVSFGDETEAIAYAVEAIKAWLKTEGALQWLMENLPKKRSSRT